MDFTPSLSAFQGVLISADSVHSFSKLSSRGGNEDKIQYVIECIQNFLIKEKYIVDDKLSEDCVEVMRKFAFYIVVNSDIKILEEMVDSDGLDFVIWTIPTIPKCLMCEILWRLPMERFIYEILVFSSPKLALEVTDALINNFKYFNPSECLDKLKLLTSAIYRMMCRFIFFNLQNNEVTYAFNNFQNCLKYFLDPPNKRKLDRLSKDEQYKFKGKCLNMMLQLLTNCFNDFVSVQNFRTLQFQQLYELTYTGINNENQTPVAMSDCCDKTLSEFINNCNIALLDCCQDLVMGVSVEIFCAWSEFEEENGNSMQQTIGEICYKVHSTLCKITSILDHPVLNMLQQISCKPLDIAETINQTDPDVIIENINKKDTDTKQWVKALIYRDKLFENQTLVDLISTNYEFLNEDESYKLFKAAYNHIQNATDKSENELLLSVRVFQRCNIVSKQEILEEHFVNDTFNNTIQTNKFHNMMVEIFNKLIISPDVDVSDVLTVFLQNPREVYKKIFTLACENQHQTSIMIKVMKLLEKFTKHYYNEETEPSLILVTKEMIAENLDTDDKQCNLTRFIDSLKKSNSIPGPKLLLLIIMPNLHKALLNKDIDCIYINCKILLETYPLSELIDYRAPTLAMLAQILDTVRWKINNFISQSPPTLELVLKLQESLLSTYDSDIPEKESTWLKSKLRNINALNMYYFRCLWNPPGNTFVEVISGIHIHKDMDMEHLTLWLSQIICSTVLKEWYQIWDSLTVFGIDKILDIFHDALLLISLVEKSNHTESSKACLMYCIKNFVATIRYKYFKPPISDSQVSTVLNKLVFLENLMRESDIEALSVILLPLIAFMSTQEDLSFKQNIQDKFKHKVFINMIQNLFNQTTIKT